MLKEKEKFIEIKGARVNNLKNISLNIPRNCLVAISGVSGSGKSSLAFDTLYAEGQRRYVESLSSYARQFLGRMSKPECDFIKGLPPAIAIEQKVVSRNPRSTVGTSTEIYEYLRLLYARIGRTYSPVSGQEVKKHSTEDIVQQMLQYQKGTKFVVMAPVCIAEGRTLEQQLRAYMLEGYARLFVDGGNQAAEAQSQVIDVLGGDAVFPLGFLHLVEQIVTQGVTLALEQSVEVKGDDGVLRPFLLQFHDLQSLEQVASSLEIAFQGAQQQALAEAAGAGEEVNVSLGQLIDEVGLVHIDESSLPYRLKTLYAYRVSHFFFLILPFLYLFVCASEAPASSTILQFSRIPLLYLPPF